MEQMPRLPNGKIDVKSLEEPAWGLAAVAEGADGALAASAAAETPLEVLMVEAWAEVLHLPLDKVRFVFRFIVWGLGWLILMSGGFSGWCPISFRSFVGLLSISVISVKCWHALFAPHSYRCNM
jgi:hypothetical protein